MPTSNSDSKHANKEIARRLYHDVWNRRKLDVLDEIISETHALAEPTIAGSAVGPEAYKCQVQRFLSAFPDLRFKLDDVITENDKLVVAWTITGTHRGEFLSISPTNVKVSFSGITINQIAAGKILDSIVMWDVLVLLNQLGASIVPAQYKSLIALS